MQVRRSRVSRTGAIAAAACIVLAHLIALRHEAEVAHVRDGHGEYAHAHALAERHEASTTPHVHGRAVDAHADGACVLAIGLDKSTHVSLTPQIVSVAPVVLGPSLALVAVSPRLAILSYAPKTSPPALA